MYYRKYFAGTVENANLTRITADISGVGNRTESCVIDDVICRAIKETLEDVGVSCEYASENSVLQIEGLSVQILRYSNGLYCSANGVVIGSMTTNSPFSGNAYRFYVTLKGDIDSVLTIAIGYYGTPAADAYGFAIGKGIDLKDGSQVRMITSIGYAVSSNGTSFFIIKDNKIFSDHKSTVNFGFVMPNIPTLSGNGTEITLVECVAQAGRFKLDNCYFGNAALGNGEFYNIGGEIYYKLSSFILVKCINEKTV